MGCGESKIKKIDIKQDVEENGNAYPVLQKEHHPPPSISTVVLSENTEDTLPNRLLAAIPISDLGESLDSRHLSESFNGHILKNGGADSVDSNDSGYDEYDEEYSHIITESSSPELVQKVERDFRPVDLPELLVITGRACTRILSGYQKNKAEEAKILSSLREEGLLAKPKIKTTGGMSFEVVDATLLENKTNSDFQNDIISNNSTTNLKNRPTTANGDAFVTAEFIPSKTLKKLELRRTKIRRPEGQLETKLAEAELRRKELQEEKVKQVMDHTGLERHGRMRSASAYRREQLYSATVAKRQIQLQEMRDKLKEKHRKNDMIKLKKQLQFDSGYNVEGLATTAGGGGGTNDFFDD